MRLASADQFFLTVNNLSFKEGELSFRLGEFSLGELSFSPSESSCLVKRKLANLIRSFSFSQAKYRRNINNRSAKYRQPSPKVRPKRKFAIFSPKFGEFRLHYFYTILYKSSRVNSCRLVTCYLYFLFIHNHIVCYA